MRNICLSHIRIPFERFVRIKCEEDTEGKISQQNMAEYHVCVRNNCMSCLSRLVHSVQIIWRPDPESVQNYIQFLGLEENHDKITVTNISAPIAATFLIERKKCFQAWFAHTNDMTSFPWKSSFNAFNTLTHTHTPLHTI